MLWTSNLGVIKGMRSEKRYGGVDLSLDTMCTLIKYLTTLRQNGRDLTGCTGQGVAIGGSER
jgi:hypothetical protein